MRRSWTQTEDDILRREYRTAPPRELAELLNRTVDSVRTRASTLGIRRDPARPHGNGSTRITRALARLAESNPTPDEYAERKRAILASGA